MSGKHTTKRSADNAVKQIINNMYETAVEKIIERGYERNNVSLVGDQLYFHIGESEAITAHIEFLSPRNIDEFLDSFLDTMIDEPSYNYDQSFRSPMGTTDEMHYAKKSTGSGDAIKPGTRIDITELRDWVREDKILKDPLLQELAVAGDMEKFEKAVNSAAYKVARKIYYVGRKPSGMKPEEWDDLTQGYRPAPYTYGGSESWENGFPYGADYQYRSGMM